MVPVLTSPTLLQNSTFVVVVKSKTDKGTKRTSNGARFDKPDIIAEFYFCSCSVKQNGHQMVPVLTSPPLLQNSTFVVVVKIKTDIKWCPF